MNDIDIEKDIEDMMKKQNYTKEDVRNAIRQEKKKGNIIDTKPKYDKWAGDNNYPDCDMLEEMGINNFIWFVNCHSYSWFLTWLIR